MLRRRKNTMAQRRKTICLPFSVFLCSVCLLIVWQAKGIGLTSIMEILRHVISFIPMISVFLFFFFILLFCLRTGLADTANVYKSVGGDEKSFILYFLCCRRQFVRIFLGKEFCASCYCVSSNSFALLSVTMSERI